MKARPSAALACLLLLPACDSLPGSTPKQPQGTAAAPALPPGAAEARALIDQGRYDDALAGLAAAPESAETAYLRGLAWTKKAMAVPPVEGGMKAEDLEALAAFERAVALQPAHTAAQAALGDLLAPYSKERHAPPPPGRRRPSKPAKGEPPPGADVDVSPERVIAAYRAVVQANKTSLEPIQALVAFAVEMQKLDDAEWAFRERLARQKESPEPHVAFGDFLLQQRKDRPRAIEQYQLALVWAPGEATIKERIADIYVTIGDEHLEKRSFAAAERAYADAQKWVPDPQAFSAARVREALNRLRAMRAR